MAIVKKRLNQMLIVLHHRHAFHTGSQIRISNLRSVLFSPAVLDESNIEFNPIPFIEQSLIVETEGFVVVDSKTVVDELPRR